MNSVDKHYEQLLADVYSWMAGGLNQNVEDNRQLFLDSGVTPKGCGKALDLGCGSGFQALALAALGYRVVAVDTSAVLLAELQAHNEKGWITAIQGDMSDPTVYLPFGPFEVVVCMGDSLVHLQSCDQVASCMAGVRKSLEPGGRLIVSFRDLTHELKGVDRAIPVRLDNDRLLTTFLEYEAEHVKVNDLLFVLKDDGWDFRKSDYRKLRLSPTKLASLLSELGFVPIRQSTERGFTTTFASVED